jgi:phage terminase small subunit
VPALPRYKHEMFCQAFVCGAHAGNGSACYKAVYPGGGQGNPTRLLRRRDVSQRIAELAVQMAAVEAGATQIALDQLAITKHAILTELAKIAFANMLDYVRPTADGHVEVDLSRLDRDKAAAIQGVVVEYDDGPLEPKIRTKPRKASRNASKAEGNDNRAVKRVRFKLADKRAALVDLGKHLGLFVEHRLVRHEYADQSDDQLIERLRQHLGELGRLGVDLGAGVGLLVDHRGTVPPPPPNETAALPALSEAAGVSRRGA